MNTTFTKSGIPTDTPAIKNSIRTIRPDAQLYTLVCTDNETDQQCINTYNGNPILTTELEELVIYTATLIHHYGKAFTYTISMVHGMEVAETNAHMLAQLEKLASPVPIKRVMDWVE